MKRERRTAPGGDLEVAKVGVARRDRRGRLEEEAPDEPTPVDQPLWPYSWVGRSLRLLGAPWDLLYHAAVTRTGVIGGEHLRDLPGRVIFAGTHHGHADFPLVRHGLLRTPARRLASRLVVAIGSGAFANAGLLGLYGQIAFGLYPLRQKNDQAASLRGLARLADAGNALLIFPQGIHADPALERAGSPAVRFRSGVGHLARALDAAVVPFGVAGTDRVIPPQIDRWRGPSIAGIPLSITRGPLAIAFGPPTRLEPDEAPPAFAARLQRVCFGLSREAEATI